VRFVDLNRSQGAAERRIAAVTNACEILDHRDESQHNIELQHGTAASLAKLLLLVHNKGNADDLVRMIIAALEMVCRGSPKSVTGAFTRMNTNSPPVGVQLLQTLLKLLDRFETGQVPHAAVSNLNIMRILHSCSRSSELRPGLIRVPGMLHALSKLHSVGLINNGPSSSPDDNPECRLLRVRIITNLANHSEANTVAICEQSGMVEALLRTAHQDANPATRQHAAAALQELSSAPANQRTLTGSETVLGTIVKLILVEKSSATRLSAVTCLQNLAYTKENRPVLVHFRNGVVLEALKRALAQTFSGGCDNGDTKVRRRAAGALTNLACNETSQAMAMHKGLLDTLAIIITKDESLDVQARACQALSKIASSITFEMECHAPLLDALVVASLSKASNGCVSAVLRVKARLVESRPTLAQHPGIIDTLCDYCVSDGSTIPDKDNSIRVILHLVNDDTNRKILCTPSVLTACVTVANYKDPDLEEARDAAIRVLERLAMDVPNRATMALHSGLVTAVAQAVEREANWDRHEDDDEQRCEQRQPQRNAGPEHGFLLAKPLLMSLLVAM
jgi:hypothetical protein